MAGDSSLDNKYWFHEKANAPAGPYQHVLDPPVMTQDVTYWLNAEAARRCVDVCAINTAIEATTLEQRRLGRLLPQDAFLRDNLSADDVLVVSVGGNDIALCPMPCTICNMLCLAKVVPLGCIEHGSCGCALPCDDCCYGCCCGCASTCCACPPCLGYFFHLFGSRIQSYVGALTAVAKPRAVIVCMIYYPDETVAGGWADSTLSLLGYDSNPKRLQALIRRTFELGVSRVRGPPGTTIVPLPLFATLDGKLSEDYRQRVEPSAAGGRKLANAILDAVCALPSANAIGATASPAS